ncbi:MAG: hypothetical protein H7X95_10235, partial [Deltaproteobacteria bacterium]|nr:hypothetical protein [Deltaproteobacteria bacterium]
MTSKDFRRPAMFFATALGLSAPAWTGQAGNVGQAGNTSIIGQGVDQQGPPAIYGFDSDEETETVPSKSDSAPTAEATTHAVRKGDTLWDISRTY